MPIFCPSEVDIFWHSKSILKHHLETTNHKVFGIISMSEEWMMSGIECFGRMIPVSFVFSRSNYDPNIFDQITQNNTI